MAKDSVSEWIELLSGGLRSAVKNKFVKAMVWSLFFSGAETWSLTKEGREKIIWNVDLEANEEDKLYREHNERGGTEKSGRKEENVGDNN